MRAMPKKGIALVTGFGLAITLAGCTFGTEEAGTYTSRDATDGTTDFVVVENPKGGATLTYAADGPVKILEVEDAGSTLAFKDMNANGDLDAWEDWRMDYSERAADLAEDLTAEQISGLMLFSAHEGSPGDGLTDPQKTYLSESHLRNILNAGGSDATENVTWANEMQAYVETLATGEVLYVPANFSSDPRSEAKPDSLTVEQGKTVSEWPSVLGLAATFDAKTVELFGRTVSEEYRALGITNALSPQIDISTEPRWIRVSGSLGENAELARELAKAYVTGFQSTYDEDGKNIGFGDQSVATTIKHAPGDGPGEGGRESHTDVGKFGVFPGGNFDEHLSVFEAAGDSLSMMTNYSIQVDGDGSPLFGDELVATAYSKEAIAKIREEMGYTGSIVTDWGVMSAATDEEPFIVTTAYGAEALAPAERFFRVLQNGVDMFGGVNDATHINEAYELWTERFEAGEIEVDADTRWRESGTRILGAYFAPGLFDNPYVELEKSVETVGSPDAAAAGFEAQLQSVVMTKNDGVIEEGADWSDKTVYIPHTYDLGFSGVFGPATYTESATLDIAAAEELFGTVLTDEVELDADGKVTSITAPDLSDVDLVLVGLKSPHNGTTFSKAGLDADTGEWYPMSLQWAPYTADGENVRKVSIGGDMNADGSKQNRSYFGNTSRISNQADIEAFERAVAAVDATGKEIPIISIVKAANPVVPTEFASRSNAVVVGFGVSDLAAMTIAAGKHDPQGRLPIGFPANMDTVEAQLEDVGEDMDTYVDADGNDWKFGFGLNFAGVISE